MKRDLSLQVTQDLQKILFGELEGANRCSLLRVFFPEITCSSLSAIAHGGFYPVKKVYEEGDVVHFFCEENYSVTEFDLIQCYSFGWRPDPPACEGISLS